MIEMMKASPLISFSRKQENQPLLALLVHWFLFATLCITAITLFGYFLPSVDDTNLCNWDANWYWRIKEMGYYYIKGRQGTLAFFPLFPFMWKLTHLDGAGISLFNLLIFSVSFFYLARMLKLGFLSSLFFLSTPSLLFCFLPYSEALFFMSSTIILVGLYRKSEPMIIIGMCLAGFTRSVNIVLIPALIYTYVCNYGVSAKTIRIVLTAIIVLTVSALVVFWIQYRYTGQWFAFFTMQRLWHRNLQLPTLPLTTFSTKVLWLDIAALFIALLALCDAAGEFIAIIFRKREASFNAATHFSMAYLAIMGFLSVFYSGIWPGQYGSSIMSLNRFVFAGPYFICYICNRMTKERTITSGIVFGLALLVALLAGGVYEQLPFHSSYAATLGYFAAIALYIALYFLSFTQRRLRLVFYTSNVAIMGVLLFDFLGYGWVG